MKLKKTHKIYYAAFFFLFTKYTGGVDYAILSTHVYHFQCSFATTDGFSHNIHSLRAKCLPNATDMTFHMIWYVINAYQPLGPGHGTIKTAVVNCHCSILCWVDRTSPGAEGKELNKQRDWHSWYHAFDPNTFFAITTLANEDLRFKCNVRTGILKSYIPDVALRNFGFCKLRPCGACASTTKSGERKLRCGERSLARVCGSAHVRWRTGSSRVGVDCCSLPAWKVCDIMI